MKLYIKLLAVTSIFILFFSCGKKDTSEETDNLYKFREYIAQHTTGRISVTEPIRLEFVQTLDQFDFTQELPANYLQISPKVSGKLLIENGRSLIFIPENHLQPDTEYTVTLKLDKFYDDLKKEFKTFKFSFKTLSPNFKITIGNLQSYSKDWQYISGTLQSNDVLDPLILKNLISVKQNNESRKVKFKETTTGARLFEFVIDSIKRFEEDSEILISWDGNSIKSETKGTTTFPIYGKNNFSVIKLTAALI
nr:Ig-like domain-containing protein [Flavobacteriales bacterium]